MKEKILIGLTCLTLLSLALPVVAATDANTAFGLNQVEQGMDALTATTSDPRVMAARIINIALGFLGIIAVVIVLYGGFMWMTAAGNEERITKAKQILTAGIIGLVIILMAWGISRYVISTLMNVSAT